MSAPLTEPTSKSQFTYNWIRERILKREFNPGYRPVLSSIAAELGVSTVPVREAIRRLEAEGLVEFERNVGARVAMVDESEYVDTMQTLGVLEGAATALALPHITDEDLSRAQAVNEQMRAMLADFDPAVFTALNEVPPSDLPPLPKQPHLQTRGPRVGAHGRPTQLNIQLCPQPCPPLRGRTRPNPPPHSAEGRSHRH